MMSHAMTLLRLIPLRTSSSNGNNMLIPVKCKVLWKCATLHRKERDKIINRGGGHRDGGCGKRGGPLAPICEKVSEKISEKVSICLCTCRDKWR